MAGLRHIVLFLLFHLRRAAERFARVMVYASAGTRQLADMQKDNQQVWQAFYASHPSHTSRLMSWERECVDRFVRPDADVLLVGCGSGRDLVPLAKRGCRLTGIDPSDNALAIAERTLRAHGLSATLIAGFFEDTPIHQTFDVVIFSYYSYSVIPMARRRIAALGKAASLLTAGGHVVISHATTTSRPHPMLVRFARLTGAIAQTDWRVESGDLVWDNRRPRPSLSYTHVFEEGELEREAAAANLGVVFRRVVDDTIVVGLKRPERSGGE